ncbi:DUF695 domain-containing protein [Flindersiella endophytica]
MPEQPDRAAAVAAIADFWTWWRGFAPQAATLIETGEFDRLGEELEPRLAAIHPDLGWDLAKPETAMYAIAVSGAGVPELRSLAERWLRAGPGPDATFEYYSAQQPNPGVLETTVDLDGHEVDLSHVAFGVRFDQQRARFDASIYHPDFLFIDEPTQLEIATLALGWALGEDDVTRWIGQLHLAPERPVDALEAPALRYVVQDTASRYPGTHWAQVTGQGPSAQPVVGLTRFPLRRVDYPLFDQHLALALPYKQHTKEGLPAPKAEGALESFQAGLEEILGSDGVLVAHLSGAGNRVLHIRADSATNAAERVRAYSGDWTQGKAHLEVSDDPSWQSVGPFLT